MSPTKIESTTIPFDCPLVNRSIRIFREYKILRDNAGQERARAISGTTCSDIDKCPVATHSASGTSYDWAKCAFIHSQK
jgi:hypothetical protein